MQSLKIHYPLISRTVKGIPSEIAKAGGIDNNWRLDDKKYGEYKKHIITFVNTKLSEINDPEYKQMPDEGKREMWNKWFKAAREIATAKVGGADIMSLIGAP